MQSQTIRNDPFLPQSQENGQNTVFTTPSKYSLFSRERWVRGRRTVLLAWHSRDAAVAWQIRGQRSETIPNQLGELSTREALYAEEGTA